MACPVCFITPASALEFPSATNLPPTAIATNRAPLLAGPFAALPLGSVRPGGWLLTQCQMQRDGLTGNAEAVYAGDIGTNSGWLGGTGDNWERSPYYYKGLISLAYVLNDAGLKQKAQKWMDWLLNNQGSDGYIGPASSNDWWPRMLATYALRDYYEATADARVPTVLSNYFHYMLLNLPARPLSDWGKARAGDEMDVALWLYNRNGDTNLLTLVNLLHQQAYDWTGIFTSNNFDFYGTDFQPKHNVNVEQALKMPGVYHQLSEQPDDFNALELGWDNLMRERGLSCGINSGTEFLSGNASIQGVELCAIVEAMLSLETSIRTTGDPVLADRLETISFNALPAALANNIKGIQYYTLPNNVIAINGGHGFNQDYANATLPGPNSGFPCCRYNFHMGWPKYVQNSWAATGDGGLALLAYGPTVVNLMLGGQQVQITEDTGYPFEEQVRLQVSVSNSVAFPLMLRIPGWCSNATITVNGQAQSGILPASFFRIARTWTNGDLVVANLPMPIQTLAGPSRSVAINRGPVVYSLKIGEQWTVSTPDPLGLGFDEYQVHSTTPWAYALQLNPSNPAASLAFTNFATPTNPFDPAEPSVELIAQARQLPDWTIGWRGTHAFEPPSSPVASTNPLETVTLVPFGSQHMRISWFPCLGVPSPTAGSFSENFDLTWSQRWTVFGGNWSARNGTLSTVPASANGARALAMETAFTNFTYEADVSVGSVGNAGLVFRVSKPDIGADAYCGYYIGIDAADSQLQFGYANNGWNSITNVPMTFAANTFYHLKVQAQGSRLRIFVTTPTCQWWICGMALLPAVCLACGIIARTATSHSPVSPIWSRAKFLPHPPVGRGPGIHSRATHWMPAATAMTGRCPAMFSL
ncbi:MAG TPA: beta-L-arabinofuranosidase domain-containing protein [Candidatus Angelobacter sp.]|nr:beta-L-arabinofuranosidase domain-containing protein [Candidatus Angelobacter sp.]